MRISRTALMVGFVGLINITQLAWTTSPAGAQTLSTLSGEVLDQNGAVLPGVAVVATSVDTGLKRETSTKGDGRFTLPPLPPGRYVVNAQLAGFQTAQVRDVVLSVNDQRSIRIDMQVSGVGETVHVEAAAGRVATSPAVSTVVDRRFVENLPLNGRSLQSLLELTPGVTLFRANSSSTEGGQFSVNGQRTNANTFMVDGISANTGITTSSGGFAGQSASGALPGLTALGSTQSLVSIDALQEFRVQTSTYSPEFGRMPGGQISMLTRSGSNTYHGSMSEYFRHDALDAKDWFASANGLPKAKLRQHDFGGTFGGPLIRNQTFFFGSYEGLRLQLPQAKQVTVPTEATRDQATPAVRALLNAYPLPNGRDLGNGTAQFTASYSDPSHFDTTAIRIDHSINDRFTLFGRYSHGPSTGSARGSSLNVITQNEFANDAVTTGATWILRSNMTNDLRLNWTGTRATQTRSADTLGGAVIPSVDMTFPFSYRPETTLMQIAMDGATTFSYGAGSDNLQQQFNLIDNVAWVTGAHNLKVGVDYRRIMPTLDRAGAPFIAYRFGPVANTVAGKLSSVVMQSSVPKENDVLYRGLSLFAQDTWTVASRLALTYGVRWELNQPPVSTNGLQPLTVVDIKTEPVVLAPQGSPQYRTTYNNFAPRLGGAYQLSEAPNRELVVRGGFGIFYDTGYGTSGVAFDEIYPLFASQTTSNVTYPLPASLTPPVPGVGNPQQFWLFDPNIKLPFTYQWNATLEQKLGNSQTLTVSYVGSAGRRLLRIEKGRPTFAQFNAPVSINYTTNAGTSAYKGLQVQFQRRLSKGLQVLANYTLAKSTDTVSDDGGFLSTQVPGELIDLDREYGPSDFDVRHAFTGGLTYDIPTVSQSKAVQAILGNWGIDGLLRARSAFPLTVLTNVTFPETTYAVRPDLVAGVPLVLTGSQYPGGRALNPAAFVAPAAGTTGNFPRNGIRGFPAQQVDLTLRRQFTLSPGFRLQLRLESFNVFNHPNFADPSTTLTGSNFGLSSQMLNVGLGSLNSLYQMGGPRSTQLSIKVLF